MFDFNDYKKIDLLIKKYNFNYIYVENYFIIDKNLIQFLDSIKNQENKKYKINLISIELSEFQLKYLIDYLPENIFYIEVNLNIGNASYTVYTCDFTHDYIDINADYRN